MLKRFPHLFLVLVIEGGALMAVELMGAKLVAPFYGGSLYVWTAVLTITVLGLTLGYYAEAGFRKNGLPKGCCSSFSGSRHCWSLPCR